MSIESSYDRSVLRAVVEDRIRWGNLAPADADRATDLAETFYTGDCNALQAVANAERAILNERKRA